MLRPPPNGDPYLCYLVSVLNAELVRKEPVVIGVVRNEGVGTAIADATSEADAVTKLNLLLARARVLGLIPT